MQYNSDSALVTTTGQGQAFLRQTGLYLLLGLGFTGLSSYFLFHNPEWMNYFFRFDEGRRSATALGWIAMFAPLVLCLIMSFQVNSASKGMLVGMYALIAAAFGVTFSTLGFAYSPQIIFSALAATVASFSGFAIWGFFTQKNLGGVGHFAFMALWGLIVLSLVQLFWHNNMLNFALGAGGVIIFTLLTAYDIQRLKQVSQTEGIDHDKLSIWFALSLYLDFINMFLSMLRLFGMGRR